MPSAKRTQLLRHSTLAAVDLYMDGDDSIFPTILKGEHIFFSKVLKHEMRRAIAALEENYPMGHVIPAGRRDLHAHMRALCVYVCSYIEGSFQHRSELAAQAKKPKASPEAHLILSLFYGNHALMIQQPHFQRNDTLYTLVEARSLTPLAAFKAEQEFRHLTRPEPLAPFSIAAARNHVLPEAEEPGTPQAAPDNLVHLFNGPHLRAQPA